LPLKKTEVKWYVASALGLILGLLLSIIAFLWLKPSGK